MTTTVWSSQEAKEPGCCISDSFVVLADTEGNLFCIIDLGHDG
jgi:hypothetical protein